MSEILAYAVYVGMDSSDERDDLLFYITAMDREYLKYAMEQRRKSQSKRPAPKTR